MSNSLSPQHSPRVISFRNIKSINPDALSAAINCLLNTHNPFTSNDLASHYNNSLYTILNSLAPLKTRSISFSTSAPWFTSKLRQMKAKGQQLERLYRKTGLVVHKDMHKNHILLYKDCIFQTKLNYYSSIICSN